MLARVEYNDSDLRNLTYHRKELAGSPEKFFRVLDKIKEPDYQDIAVRDGVESLFKAGKHDLVVPLVNALGKRTFKSDRLKEETIRKAFFEGTKRGNQDIVESYYGYPAVTSGEYAIGLSNSWNKGKPNQVFPFLLKQADQGDLEKIKEGYVYGNQGKFCQVIDKAFDVAPSAGIRQAYYSLKDETVTFDASKALLLIINCGTTSVQRVRAVLRDTGKTPLDLHRKVAGAYLQSQPQIVELLHDAYRKKRSEARTGDEFDETFDCNYFESFHEALTFFRNIGEPQDPKYSFNRQEVFCDVVYFHRLIDFEDAVKCYELTRVGSRDFTPKIMSGLFGDALLGYMDREDLVDKEDEMAVKWATQTVGELEGGRTLVPAGHMLHAALRLRKSHPTLLLDRFLKAVITIRLSDVLDWTNGKSKPKDLYNHLKKHSVTEEHFFDSGTRSTL